MPDYKNGKIYKLWSPQGTDDEIYIGSTCNDLRFRKKGHKDKYKNNSNNYTSKILFEKYDDVRIELIENYPCNSKAELNKREGHHIRENKCLNKCVAGRTKNEYRDDNKEQIKQQNKNYYIQNKEKVLESCKNYREKYKDELNQRDKEKITCNCGCIVNKRNLKKHQKTPKHIKLMEEIIN